MRYHRQKNARIFFFFSNSKLIFRSIHLSIFMSLILQLSILMRRLAVFIVYIRCLFYFYKAHIILYVWNEISFKKNKILDIILSPGNHLLDRVCSYKYLGFILDDHVLVNVNKWKTDC